MYAPFYAAVREFFGLLTHAGLPVPVVFSSPDRAHTEMSRVISRRTQGAGGAGGDPLPRGRDPAPVTQPTLGPKPVKRPAPTAPATSVLSPQESEDRPAPVPFMSLWMQPGKFDPARFSPATIRGYERDIESGTALNMRWPRPVNFEVQVDLWCGSAGGHNIAQQIEGQTELHFLAESVYLPVNWNDARWYKPPFNVLEHAKVLGQTRARLVSEGWADNSEIEAGEGSKEVRRTWTGRLEAQIPFKPEEARLVRSFVFAVYDNTNPETPVLLDALTGGVED